MGATISCARRNRAPSRALTYINPFFWQSVTEKEMFLVYHMNTAIELTTIAAAYSVSKEGA